MYKRNFKQRKTQVQDSEGPQTTTRPNSSFTSFSTSFNTSTSKANPSVISTKRKNLFDDFDLSDLKTDKNLPSFMNTSSVINNTTIDDSLLVALNEDNNNKIIKSSKTTNAADLSFIDENDLLLEDFDVDSGTGSTNDNKKQQQQQSVRSIVESLTEEDTKAMMQLVKNNISHSDAIGPKNSKQFKQNESLSELLDDSFELDDLDLEEIISRSSDKNGKKSCSSQNSEFTTASGKRLIRPSELSYRRSKEMFIKIEQTLINELSCYIWNESQQNITEFFK